MAFESCRAALEEWFLEEPERIRNKLTWILGALAALSIAPLLGARHLWRIGQSVIGACRFPPPGRPVVVDTRVIMGAKVIFRGRLLEFGALFLAACAVVVPMVVWWASQRLLGDA